MANNKDCDFRTSIGGQALIEGILMRGPKKQAIVCRTAEGLVDEGILDSLDIVTLVTEIDAELGVTVPAEEILPENFNSAAALYDLITRLDRD